MKRVTSSLRTVSLHPLAKGGVIVFVGTMVANIGAYLYHLVVGRIMGPVGYGELAALLSLSYIFNVFVVLLQTVVTKFVSERTPKSARGDIRALVVRISGILIGVGGACIVGLIIVAPVIVRFLNIEDSTVIPFLFLGVLFTLLGTVYTSVLQGLQRFAEGMVILNINSILRLAAGAAFASLGVTAALAANAGAIFVATLIALIPIRHFLFSNNRDSQFHLARLFKATSITFFSILGISVLNSQDVVLAKHFLSAESAGLYGALSTMGKIIFFVSYSVSYVLLPIVSERSAHGKQSNKLVYVSIAVVAGLSGLATVGFFLWPRFVLGLLYGDAFLEAATLLGQFGIFSSFYTIAYTIVMALIGLGRSTVWTILIGAAILQDILLMVFHEDISSMLRVNITVAAGLVVVLLLYYRQAGNKI